MLILKFIMLEYKLPICTFEYILKLHLFCNQISVCMEFNQSEPLLGADVYSVFHHFPQLMLE